MSSVKVQAYLVFTDWSKPCHMLVFTWRQHLTSHAIFDVLRKYLL